MRNISADGEFSEDELTEVSNRMSDNPIYESNFPRLSSSSSSSLKSQSVKGSSPQSAASAPQFKVLYDFDATETDDLSLQQGDIVSVIRKSEDGWWFGETVKAGGVRRGHFPATYVEEADA